MIITQEWIDIVAPEHGRTSCSDFNIVNGNGGWTGYFNTLSGKKEFRYPRCIRCYLMKNIGMDTNDISFRVECALVFKENGG